MAIRAPVGVQERALVVGDLAFLAGVEVADDEAGGPIHLGIGPLEHDLPTVRRDARLPLERLRVPDESQIRTVRVHPPEVPEVAVLEDAWVDVDARLRCERVDEP
jgi:hypothetical protein